ncbi:MAG: peptidoglycan-binding protein [Coriobacteriia bacterium]|nr:peptidoglycan-binding protein [Coriobacteriia bacterium]MBS5479127.1 peptidoglycan-binding protein [Coriobacteriia bacterium]
MKPICKGQTGPAVEDVQHRLITLNYTVDPGECEATEFGPTTLVAVRAFRSAEGLPAGDEIDDQAWAALVDATYQLGDRTLYLRLPYFHGADVSHLQMTLNVLGFSCGEVDGYYGPHTEAAVREFQDNAGLYADGMAFQDTFDAIERLHHVWMGKTASPEFSKPHTGLVRAVDVLSRTRVLACGVDPISRSMVSRMWNVACATTPDASFTLTDTAGQRDPAMLAKADVVLTVSTVELPEHKELSEGTLNVIVSDLALLPGRVASALQSLPAGAPRPLRLRVELPGLNNYDGSVTDRTVQSVAITLLDALCAALDAMEA